MDGAGMRLPEPDAVLTGPIWPGPVRVLRAVRSGPAVRIVAVGVADSQYYDRTLTLEQFAGQVREVVGGQHRFDADPRLFRLATEALRIHLAHAFDPQFAVSVSQVDPLPHQLDAVYKHMLPQPTIRFLLADDPGAGKTIMAGLLMRELMQRGDVRRVLVLCPKALTDQWRRELWERFRERFTLFTGDTISGAFGQNVWIEHDHVIASVDLAVQAHIVPGLEQASWDLVVFDEAHKLSAYRYGDKVEKTRRYQLAEQLAKRTRHILLMTATPHRGDDENFRLLLALLDDTVFATQSGVRRALERDRSPFFLRRMKEAMRDFGGRPLFLPRHVSTIAYPLEAHEQALYDAVTDYVAQGMEKAESARNRNVGLAMTVLQRRLASSLFAITRSLERRRDRLTEALDAAIRTGRVAAAYGDAAIPDDPDEETGEYSDEQEASLSGASTARSPEELRAEITLLHGLIARAHAAIAAGPEKKLREFLEVVRSQTVADRAEKILVFTEHKDTLVYLTERVREWGYTVCNIHGGMPLRDRIAAEREFRGPTQFLIATDAAGEGINLQFCRVMVNWDLPWNPNRLEQRMGRIHRYGQEFEVQIVNLVAETTREGQVLIRLMDKLRRMKDALGHDQVYDIIARVLDGGQVRLDALLRQAILHRRSLDAILADLDFADDEPGLAGARETLGEALATDHIDMAFINAGLRESKERRLTPEYVERFFVDALRHAGGRIAPGRDRDWRVEHVPADIRRSLRATGRADGADEAANGAGAGNDARLVTLRKERARAEPPAEFVAPDHPLFDAVVERVLDAGRPALVQGTAFHDPKATEPSLVWLLEAGVVNGEGRTVHRRLLAVRQRADGGFEPVSPGALLDLAPADAAPSVPAELRGAANGDAAIGAAGTFYAGEYLAEVQAEQARQAAIVERALEQSANEHIGRLQERLERQYADQERGKDMALAIRNTNAELAAMTNELARRRVEIERRRVTSIDTPRIVGVAAVLPAPAPAAGGAEGAGGDQSAIELAAMAVALAHERAQGRTPEDVSRLGQGYDIRSVGPAGEIRYIEVKGHAARGDVTLYYTEWQTAHRMRAEFYLYEVDYALAAPQLWITRDPVGRGIEPTVRVVEYRIKADELRAVAERAG